MLSTATKIPKTLCAFVQKKSIITGVDETRVCEYVSICEYNYEILPVGCVNVLVFVSIIMKSCLCEIETG